MDRRAFLSLAAGAAVTSAAWAGGIEPTYFELTHTTVRLGTPRPWRILHISDIHMSDGVKAADIQNAVESGLAQKPDLVFLTGDFVSSIHDFNRQDLFHLLRRVRGAAPSYAVLGNHDSGTRLARGGGSRSTKFMQDLIRSSGVRLLYNESVTLEGLTLVGVADLWSGAFNLPRAFSAAPPDTKTLLLCHNPDGKDLARHWR
ncbi:MAG: metallophosphoesterase, partial [Acidobacteriota bacterium]